MNFLLLQVLARFEEEPDFAKETVERHLLKEVMIMTVIIIIIIIILIVIMMTMIMMSCQVLCCAGIHRNNVLFNTSRCKIGQHNKCISLEKSIF